MTTGRYGVRGNVFDSIVTYGSNNNTILDKLCAFLLAISPILQHYKGIYKNAGFTVLLLISPFIIMRLMRKFAKGKCSQMCFKVTIPLLLFQIYKMFDHTITVSKMFYGLFMLMMFVAIACGCINIRYFFKYATIVSLLAGIFLIIQYFSYYLFHFHIQLVPTSLLLPESDAWILGVQTGLYGLRGVKNGFYRPCAFFLEPSHLFLYSFPILCLLLFSPDIDRRRIRTAVLVSTGIILSTSGMGVTITSGLWIAYFILYYSHSSHNNIARLKNMVSARKIPILMALLLLLVFAYFQVGAFQNSVNRIFSSGSTGKSTAIEGRTRLARMLVQDLSGKSFFIGLTEDVKNINFNLSGFFATYYKYGIVGIILSYLFYILSVFKLKGAGFWTSLIILVISFFTAHTHGTFYMMYFVIIIMNGHYTMEEMKINHQKQWNGPIKISIRTVLDNERGL